jgi:hypothetical protein
MDGVSMRFTDEMKDLKNSRRYPAARQLLDDILHKRQPNFGLLTSLYGEAVARGMAKSIATFYSNPNFVPGKLREHDTNAPTLLSDSRQYVDNDFDFIQMETYLAPQINRIESIDSLIDEIRSEIGINIHNKFGPYTDYVIKETALAIHHQLKRKCKISTVCHWMGTAGLMHFLQVNKHIPEHPIPYFRVMVTFSHDFKEDLPRKVLHKDGSPYGLYRTEEFGHDHLPPEKDLIRDDNILTNLYTEVPKYAYELIKSQGSAFTQDKFRKFLTDYMNTEKDIHSPMYKIHGNLSKFMSTKNYGLMSGKELLDAISWDTYEFYVNRIWSKSIKFRDDTPIIAKFCDQSYNFMGKEVLSDPDLTRNLQKLWLWASEVYSSAINLPHTNDFVRELLEDALCYSEHYIIKDFMKSEANILFNNSKFMKILDLSPIFYIDKKLSSGYILSK